MNTKMSEQSIGLLQEISGTTPSLRRYLNAIREGEEMNHTEFARKLGISRSRLCDIFAGRRFVSVKTAGDFAKRLRLSRNRFVQLALQDEVSRAGYKLHVTIKAA